MEIHYQCDLADYREAFEAQFSSATGAYVLVAGAVFFLVIGCAAGIRSGFSAPIVSVLFGGLLLLFPVALRVMRKLWVDRDFRRHPNFGGQARLITDDQSLRTDGELERRETKWSAFSRFQETTNLFILFEGPRFIRVFPKRAFSSSQLDEFRLLVKSKIVSK